MQSLTLCARPQSKTVAGRSPYLLQQAQEVKQSRVWQAAARLLQDAIECLAKFLAEDQTLPAVGAQDLHGCPNKEEIQLGLRRPLCS